MSEPLADKGVVRAGFVRYADGAHPVDGYLARPSDDRSHPGVVLIQEWWGIEPHIKQLAEKLAASGYVVLAPDLYHGKVATKPDDAMKAMMALNFSQAVAEIDRGLDYLRARPDVSSKKIGVTGFCMGGLLSWKTAEAHSDKLAAIAPFYGGKYHPTADDIRKIHVPVLTVWGSRDGSIPASERDHIVGLLRAAGKAYEARVYDAPHGFMNDTHGNHAPEAAEEAWGELLAWFGKYLR
jgi:carboxymethylenebutenolidase